MSGADIRTLLDAGAMRGVLARIPLVATGAALLKDVSLERVWVKPGRHFHASYRIQLDTEGGQVETLAQAGLLRDRTHASDVRGAIREIPPGAPRSGEPARWEARLSTALVESPPALVQLFPWDYRLPTLPLAFDLGRLEAELAPLTLRRCEVAGYWPGMRCQIRYHLGDPGGTLYGKVVPHGAGAALGRSRAAIEEKVGDGAVLVTPKQFAELPELNLVLTEPIEGHAFIDLLRDGGGAEAVPRVAAALALFHSLPVSGIEGQFQPDDDLAVVGPWVVLVSTVFPDLAAGLEEALTELRKARPAAAPAAWSVVHRDFYDRQVLVSPSRIAFLDLDTVCRGHAEIDVANFCAHFVLRGLQWHSRTEAFARLGEEFVTHYRGLRPSTDVNLFSWYLASALLRLACVYSLRPWWHSLTLQLVEASRRALER